MKKVFALLTVAGMLTFGTFNSVYAQADAAVEETMEVDSAAEAHPHHRRSEPADDDDGDDARHDDCALLSVSVRPRALLDDEQLHRDRAPDDHRPADEAGGSRGLGLELRYLKAPTHRHLRETPSNVI